MSITSKKTTELRPHPRQAELFGEPPEPHLRALARTLQAGGPAQRVEVLSDGTVVFGHDEFRAAQMAGLAEVEVRVLEGLEEYGEAEVLVKLAEDNLRRPYRDPFERVLVYKQMREAAWGRPYPEWGGWQRGAFRDAVVKRLGPSARTVERYLRVLGLPEEVQAAFATKQITLCEVQRLAGLPAGLRQEVAVAIREGHPVRDVIRKALTNGGGKEEIVGKAVARFVRNLGRVLADLEGRTDSIGRLSPKQVTTLERGEVAIRQLLRQAAQGQGGC